ncbi:Bifunctional purine biosynthesis protein PurH [Coemansia biformis]|uniref:Bifunctional purine biosynthesis protein PurH n=1 Tax=Coemansia biformis TaxID=1286918 RepID=A0A9W8CX43_9FUNG|nr:Bifunctional purine biosynthesis protein PurH [Coemansia biformis]
MAIYGRNMPPCGAFPARYTGRVPVPMNEHERPQCLAANAMLTMILYLAARLCSGVASTVVATYNSECAPARVRGFAGVVLQLSVEIGIFISQLAAILLVDVPNWRILFGLGAAFSVVQLLWLPFLPESPKYLVSQGRFDKARSALHFLRPGHDISREFDAIVAADQVRGAMAGPEAEAGFVADAGDEPKVAEDDGASGMASLHTAAARRRASNSSIGLANVLRGRTPDILWHPLFCTLFLMGFQQWTGTKGIVFYSTEIMVKVFHLSHSQVQHTPNSAQWVTIGLAGMGIVGVLTSMCLIDRLGRRRLLILSTGGLAVACLLVAVGCIHSIPALAVVAMFAFKAAYCLGMAPIPWLCASEMLPYYALGALSGAACALNWLMIFTVGLLFPVLAKALGNYLFLLFAGLNSAGFVVVLLFIPETKGCHVSDIIWHHGKRVHIVLSARKARCSALAHAGLDTTDGLSTPA